MSDLNKSIGSDLIATIDSLRCVSQNFTKLFLRRTSIFTATYLMTKTNTPINYLVVKFERFQLKT